MKIRYMLLYAYGMGGTVRTVITQANAMAAAGHDVTIVNVVRHRKEPQFTVDPRVKIDTLVDIVDLPEQPPLSQPVKRFRHWHSHWLAKRPAKLIPKGEAQYKLFDQRSERAIIEYVRHLDGGVLVTTRPALNLLAARYANPTVARVAQDHMNLAAYKPSVQRQIKRWYHRMDAVVVLTHGDEPAFREAVGDSGARVLRIPNAVESLDQEPSDHTNKIVIAVGRLFRQKGFDLLIPAFEQVVRKHPDWQLRIFGTGEKRAELRAMIDERHLYNNVYLMGKTTQMPVEMQKASIMVLSSRFEGLPMVMIEAMSHALPVVAFDCPTGPADVLTHNADGILVPPEDVDGLAEALIRLIENPAQRVEMGTAALKTVTNYGPDAVNPRWESLFEELLAAKPSAT